MGDSTVHVHVVEVSVHQGPVGVTSVILVMKQAPTMDIMVPAPQCATVLMCATSRPHVKCAAPCPE